MIVEVLDPLKEDALEEDVVEFKESQEIRECIANLEAMSLTKSPNEEISSMKVEVLEPLAENSTKENVKFGVEHIHASPNQLIVDGENKKVQELLANLEVPCEHSKSFFEDSVKYILQPQGLHPLLKKMLQNEATRVPFDPPHVSIPWDPGGNPFDKFLPSNFKPP